MFDSKESSRIPIKFQDCFSANLYYVLHLKLRILIEDIVMTWASSRGQRKVETTLCVVRIAERVI